jgi:hypothetical protein
VPRPLQGLRRLGTYPQRLENENEFLRGPIGVKDDQINRGGVLFRRKHQLWPIATRTMRARSDLR